ncbi:Undecaprenyl-phosphate 4-deoxy-4-formamido-L-arabinose transferase [bioreactor metagenome]|uniref:Undecaprenyl-phosphate 4-deoxy-4-formamido-L-arabinose transferase n=1 Tax=bioreactor metagenome TaxID=1076179 RepID=A0A645BC41_9ZZZZ
MDDTPEVCKQFGIRYINQEEPHYGGAMRTAFKYASMDKLLLLDADGSPDPKYIPELYKALASGADLVIGSRHAEGGSNADTKSANIMSKICNGLYRVALGVTIRDCSTSYRIYHTADVKKLTLMSENFDIMEEILLKLKLLKGKNFIAKEIPTHSIERGFGKSKRSLLKFIYTFGKTLIRMVILRLLAVNGYKPEKHERLSEMLTKIVLGSLSGILICIIALIIFLLIF